MIKNNKGSTIITTPVIIAIGMILISVLIVFTIKILMPYIWYEKLSSTCIKYIFVMEDYGYLTKTEKKKLIEELEEQGFEEENLKLEATSRLQKYGEPIYLNIKYKYDLDIPMIDLKTINMEIKKSSVSKR
ncbi:MAG: hypothetical protein J6B87_03535 [Clostridia bacterium]|nr:hypothetical protein [Clostridia bacterium]